MTTFTHFDLQQITKNESEVKSLLEMENKKQMYSPKQKTIDNILNYSKALSVRKSENIEFIEIVLN